MGEMKKEYNILVRKLEGNNHIAVNGRIIYILKKEYVRVWIGFIWLRREARSGILCIE
jgi:hypothetical protein